ncbi:hypothetical protein KSP40_PGU004917 [Platanthera guangdongensis]|uniref:Pentatricopeptide repeat-containing protein n=1 Tax=Platanthera guangdongensis TaxID=2320717 RepID=A0ABR2MJ78_9ASPA
MAFCREGCLLEAFRIFDSLEYNGLVPTIATYATLIGALSREGFLLDAKMLFGRMVAKGISPNTLTYNSLINGHCRFGLLEEGIELVKTLAGSSMELDSFTISSIICGYCSKGDIQGLFTKGRMEEARNIIRDMLQHGEVVDLINKAGDEMNFESLANYIKLVCEEGRIQEVISILSDVGSKIFSSWWSKNSSIVKEVKQHFVGVDGYHFLQQNSLDYDFETYYSFIAALCSNERLLEQTHMESRSNSEGDLQVTLEESLENRRKSSNFEGDL